MDFLQHALPIGVTGIVALSLGFLLVASLLLIVGYRRRKMRREPQED
jgi:hypothetical protein